MAAEQAPYTAALRKLLLRGAGNGQSTETLAFILGINPRQVRKQVDALIEEGVCVCAHPDTGYFIAEDWAEVDRTYEFLRHRGLCSLHKAAQLRDAFANEHYPQQPLEIPA